MTGTPSGRSTLNLQKVIKAIDPGVNLYDTENEDKGALAVGEVRLVFKADVKHPRHSLYILNKSATDAIHLRNQKSKTGSKITIHADSDRTFEPHIVGLIHNPELDVWFTLLHCEWGGDVYLYNPGAATVHFEAYEVL